MPSKATLSNKLRLGDVVRVDGWVMLKGLEAGSYRVCAVGAIAGRVAYSFSRAKGRLVKAKHYADAVDAWVRPGDSEDLNKIVVISRGQKKT